MLEEIKKKVQDIANNSREQIIMGVYHKMVLSHNDFCGCNYCIILKDYVQTKKYLSALNRRMNSPDYDYWDGKNVLSDLTDIEKVRITIKELKLKKNVLKQF